MEHFGIYGGKFRSITAYWDQNYDFNYCFESFAMISLLFYLFLFFLHIPDFTKAGCFTEYDWDYMDERADENSPPWGYQENGPDTWSENYPSCGGDKQSPINLTITSSTPVFQGERIKFIGYDKKRSGMILVNKGYTVELELAEDDEDPPCIEGGDLNAKYCFTQLHFHWGLVNSNGSEHIINTNRGIMEMHLVHTNPNEQNDDKIGVAVLGVLYRRGYMSNTAYEPITNALNEVIYKGSKTVLTESVSLDALLPNQRSGFYRYEGSLTTPPCTEGVIWTVFSSTTQISDNQMQMFRRLQRVSTEEETVKPIAPNFRPVQPLNGRRVYRYM